MSHPLRSRHHVLRSAATSEFMACRTGCCCTRRRRRSGGGARQSRASSELHQRHGVARARLLRAKDVEAAVLALRAHSCVVHDGPDEGDFVPAAREACHLDVHRQQQPVALCAHPPPI